MDDDRDNPPCWIHFVVISVQWNDGEEWSRMEQNGRGDGIVDQGYQYESCINSEGKQPGSKYNSQIIAIRLSLSTGRYYLQRLPVLRYFTTNEMSIDVTTTCYFS